MAGADALLAHRVRVMRLYRHSLKQMMSWAIQKSLIYEEFKNIRSQFEANKNVVSTPSALTEPGGAAPEANPAFLGSTSLARSNTLADGTRSCLRFHSRRAARTHARNSRHSEKLRASSRPEKSTLRRSPTRTHTSFPTTTAGPLTPETLPSQRR